MPQVVRSAGQPSCNVSDRLAAAAAVVDAFPGSTAVVDPDGVIVAVNAAWEAFARENGRDTVDDVGRSYLACAAPEHWNVPADGQRLVDGIRAVLAGTQACFEQTYPCHSPTVQHWFRCEARALTGPAGVAGAAVIHVDVTHEVASAVRSATRLRQLADAADAVGAYWWDWRIDAGRIEVSPVLARQLNAPAPSLTLRALIGRYLHPDDRAPTARLLKRIRDGGTVTFDHEVRLLTCDGAQWVHSRGQITRDGAGRVGRVAGIVLDIEDRHALSDELVRQRAVSRKTALVAERTDNGVIVTDPQGRIEWVNAGFERLSGYALNELTGRRPGDVLQGPESDPDTIAALSAAVADRRAASHEIVNYAKTGRPYWVEIDLQPVFDERGELEQFIAIQRDVTERKREAGLHAAREAGLRHTLDGDDLRATLPDVVAALEGAFINARIAVLTPALDGDHLQCVAAPNLPRAVRDKLAKVPTGEAGGLFARARQGVSTRAVKLASDGFWSAGASADRPDGLVDGWAEPLIGLDGRPHGVMALLFGRASSVDAAKTALVERAAQTLAHVIEREEREAAVRRSERRFRALAEVLPVFVSYVDRDLRFGYTNAGHDAFLGVPQGSLLGRPAQSIFAERSWPEVADNSARALAGERVRIEARREFWDGRARQVQETYVPDVDVDADGAVAGFYCIVEDITEFRRREAELRHAKEQAQASSAAKSAFLANMSHELRTPLNAVIGYSEMIQTEMLGPIGHDKYKGYIDDIHASGKYLLNLIEDVLDLSKLDAGARALSQDQVAVEPVVQQALVVLGMADDPRISVAVGPEVRARGDPRALQQVLVNLVANAAKYAPGAAIRVTGWNDGGTCMIAVADDGPGIPPEEVPRITEPFYTVDQRSWIASDAGGGTGIGLALVKRLVEEMGGRLAIESVLGEGTTVTLRMRTLV